jgi:hypothetical protein
LRQYFQKQNIFLVLFGLCLAFLALEVSLRLFSSQLSQSSLLAGVYINKYRLEADPFLYKKTKPDLDLMVYYKACSYPFKTVSLGYEGIGFRDDGINSECFAVAVGDSMTEGFIDSENVWVELLEKETGLDFVNMGVNGYSPLQYTRMLQKYGAPLRPKLVLWVFYLNDLEGNSQVNKKLHKEATIFSPIETWLICHSLAYKTLQLMRGKTKKLIRGTYSPIGHYKEDHLYLRFPLNTVKQNLDMPEIREGWKLTQENLMEAKAICQDIKAKLVVILAPYKEQAYWHIVNGMLKDSEGCDVDQLYTIMRNFCEEKGITCLDLTPTFREHAQKGEQLYYAEDCHWNKEGNHLAAEAVLAFLRQEGLIPPSKAFSGLGGANTDVR